jgi:hypothetical protein
MIWDSRNVQELRAKASSLGVQYALIRHDFLLDHDSSTIVDDSEARKVNDAKLQIARDFVLDAAHAIRSDKKFSLVKIAQ